VTDAVIDLFDAKQHVVRCPHRAYAEMYEHSPMWVDRIQAYAVVKYDEVLAVLQDTDHFSAENASGPGSVTPLARRLVEDPSVSPELKRKAQRRLDISRSLVLLNADPPMHARQRRLVSKAFTARRIAEMESDVEKIAVDLFESFADAARADMVRDFSIQLPMTVIANVLGIPSEMYPTFKRWSDAFVAGTGSMNLGDEEIDVLFTAIDEFYDYFTEQITLRTEEPEDDLLSALVTARTDEDKPLQLNEMLQMLVQFLTAGNETTTNLLSSTMYMLLHNSEVMARVRADRSLLPGIIEEVLRMEAPVQGLFRTATADVEVGGRQIPAGATVYVTYGAANRDETVFADAGSFLPGRQRGANHFAFGRGEHFCLGAQLARLECRVGISTWLDRTTDIQLDADPVDVTYLPSFVLHGVRSLPVRFTTG
jgi:cytochrome P450